ncbi:hypothetical protein D3C76_1058640 [compost metagenome]
MPGNTGGPQGRSHRHVLQAYIFTPSFARYYAQAFGMSCSYTRVIRVSIVTNIAIYTRDNPDWTGEIDRLNSQMNGKKFTGSERNESTEM